jgi:MFS family permease
MGRHARDEGSTGAEGATVTQEVPYEVEAFEGEGKRKIDLANPAPFGYSIAFTLGLVALVDRADSALVGGVLPTLQDYFGFGDLAAGFLLSAPSVAALLLVVPAGRFADTGSRKMLLSIVILAWGLLTFGAAAAPTFALFFLARVLLGIATPLNIPASASIVGDTYRSEARTKAFAIVRVSEYLGFPVGVLLGGVIGQTLGWRPAFLIMGVPAVLLAAYIALRLKEPKRGLADDLSIEAERAGLEVANTEDTVGFDDVPEAGEPVNLAHTGELEDEDAEKIGIWTRIKEVLSIRTLRWIIIGQAMLFAGFSGLFAFAPTFFFRVQDLEEGAAAAISGGLGMIGLLAGGALASRIGDRHHGERKGWRVFVSAIALTIAALSVLGLATITSLPIQIVFYLIINFANIIALANLGAAQADVIPARLRGTGFATAQFLITIGSSTGALIVGAVSGRVISGETDITGGQVNDAKDALEDAEEVLEEAQEAGNAAEIAQAQLDVDAAQSAFDALDTVFGPAQALGIRWGVAALFVVLICGALTIFKARMSYDDDAAKVLAYAGSDGGEAPARGMH